MAVGSLKTVSIVELQGLPSAQLNTNDVFFVRDQGFEGNFIWEPQTNIPLNDPRLGALYLKNNNSVTGSFRRIIKGGEVNIEWFGALGNNIANDFDAFNRASISVGVSKIIIGSVNGKVYLVNGTLNFPSSITLKFENGGKINGSCTLNGGIIDAEISSNVFGLNVDVYPSDIRGGYFSINWFGADVNKADNSSEIQKTFDNAVRSNIHKVCLPIGEYKIQKGVVVIGKYVDSRYQFVNSFEILGGSSSYGGATAETRITLTGTSARNTFGIGFQKVKGVRVKNVFLSGLNRYSNDYPSGIGNLTPAQIFEDSSTNWTSGCSTKLKSPHAGFIVDPFFAANGLAPGNSGEAYPGFESYYNDIYNGGSTDVIFENCSVKHFVIGYCISPHDSPQNGECISISNSWGDHCMIVLSTGQHQTRTVLVNNFKCWGQVHTVFDFRTYGEGTGSPAIVNGINLAGGIKQLCVLNNWLSNGLVIRDMHAELLGSLGGNFTTMSGSLVIHDSWINLTGATIFPLGNGTKSIVHAPVTVFQGGLVKIVNSYLTQYGSSFATPLQISANQSIFESCKFDFIPLDTNNPTTNMVFRDCVVAGFDNPFGDHSIIFGIRPIESANSRFLFLSAMEWHMDQIAPGGLDSNFKRVVVDNATNRGYSFSKDVNLVTFNTNSVNLQFVDHSELTATFSLQISSEDLKKIRLGDFILTTTTDEYGKSKFAVLGTVTSQVNGQITLKGILKSANTSTSYPIFIYRPKEVIPTFIIGNITAGSNVVSSVDLEGGATSLRQGVTIKSDYFPHGTYVVSYASGTLTLSNTSNTTKNNVVILSENWQSLSWGFPNIGNPYGVGYKEGDIIYNIAIDTFPDVLFWMCKKSGITGSTRLPEFKAFLKS